jgi:hypothetical protein
MEHIGDSDFLVETGFSGYGPSHLWEWERFEQSEAGPNPLPQIYLYKLHGSINWKRDEGRNLFSVEQTENVDPNRMDVIFGRNFKLEAGDPYLFYAYQFRRFTLDAKLIVVIGYGFADSHINKILAQALNKEELRRLLVVANCDSEEKCKDKETHISKYLDIPRAQVKVELGTAKSFFEDKNRGPTLIDEIPQPKESPF